MNTIGQRIKALREDSDLSQKELAANVNITEATLSRYENDLREPKVSIIIRLAKELNTTTDFLLGLSENPYDKNQTALGLGEIKLLRLFCTLTSINKVRIIERAQALAEMQDNDTNDK